MSDENQETIADIVAEIRGAKTEFPFVYLMGEPDTQEVIDAKTKEIIEPRKINIRRVTVNELADRIEAAAKREREASGNAAAMCKALCDIVMLTMKVGHSIHGDVACGIIASKAKHALSAPRRNCDVGTAEEQESRFHATGETYHTLTLRNAFAWAQMPYEEGG